MRYLTHTRRLFPAILVALVATAIGATPALAADSDGDGMPNRWEKRHDLNAYVANAKRNPDHDGLTNIREYRRDGHPRLEDSDFDGVDDGDEVEKYETDVEDRDSDDDGRIDGHEDSDGDGVKDEDEDDANESCLRDDDDSDEDGVKDEDENELALARLDSDSDGDGVEDGDEDGEANEDEDDSDSDACDGDLDEDGDADEDEHDRFGTVLSYDSATGALTIVSGLGYEVTAAVGAETELEWGDCDCDGELDLSTADLVEGAEIAEIEIDEDMGTFEEVVVVCPLAEQDD